MTFDPFKARVRWGRGFTMTTDTDHQLIGIIDGHGNPVPQDEWDEFREFQESERAAWWDAMCDSQDRAYRMTRGITGYQLPWERTGGSAA